MWIWILVIAVVIGAILGLASSGKSEDALGGALAGGCLAGSCMLRLVLFVLGIALAFWVFGLLFG